MPRERVLRLEVLSRELLEWLLEQPLPAGFREDRTGLELFRAVYFDTPGGDLERRGATVRLCIRQDGTHVLGVDVRVRELGDGLFQRSHAEAVVPAVGPPDLFAGDSEPARLVRALVDPGRLSAVMELETTRRVRFGVSGEEPPARVRIAYDIMTVRRDEVVGELYEVELRMPDEPPGRFEGLVRSFEEDYGLHALLGDVVGRARDLVSALEGEGLAERLRVSREVAVIAYDQGRIALCRSGGEGLRVPTGPGSGREACHRVLRGWLGGVRGRVRVLGTSPATSQIPALEVWVAEDAGPAATAGGRCAWIPLEQVLEAAGSAQLRDPRTLAALALVARSDLPAQAAGARAATPAPPPAEEPLELVALRWEAEEAEELEPKEVRPELLLNRELCRLAFDERILVMAEDERIPLLERVRFTAIFGSRQDDFFMTRVAESKEQVAAGITRRTPDGLRPGEQLDVIRIRACQIAVRAYRLLIRRLLPALEREGVCLLRWRELDEEARRRVMDAYWERIEALITPLVTDPSHPFPHIRNLRPAIAAIVRLPESTLDRFVAIELPGELPRFLPLADGHRYVPLEELILAGLPRLYPGLDIVRAHTFRVTRSATSQLPEEAGDVMAAVEDELATRPFRQAVRLEVEEAMPEEMRRRLLRELRFEAPESPSTLTEADVYAVPWLVDLAGLAEIAALDIPALKYPPLERGSPLEPGRSVFDQVRERDCLIAFPDHDFEATVGRFMAEAADDPAVLSIKTTLYRTDTDSPVVYALERARSAGKDAFALVELKASFDERRNVDWARSLDSAGVHVVFSPARYKIHAKIALVVRDEPDGVRRYIYIGTGNLNASTAAAYTDVGLLTADPELGEELNAVFSLLTGYSTSAEFPRLLVAPFQMRRRFLELIDREAEHARAGRGGHIRAQMNGLSDRRIVAALYRASQAGARIELAVREICRLRPGLPGISENIRVVSLLGRLLQHRRIFYFGNAGEPEYYIGSADWRPRNLLRRVEIVTPVDDPQHRATLDRMLREILEHPDAWELRSDGAYVRGDEVIGGIGLHGRRGRPVEREKRTA